jgi:anti-anti-sigma factor
MEVLETSLSGIPLLQVVGDVDHYTSRLLDAAAHEAFAHDGGRLIFDFSGCPYLDSGGVGVLLSLIKTVRDIGWVGVIGASQNLLRVFEIVGLLSEPRFRVFANEMEASAVLKDAAR